MNLQRLHFNLYLLLTFFYKSIAFSVTNMSGVTKKQLLKDILQSPAPKFERNGSIEATRIIECKNSLGECILYDDKANKVLWTNIYGKEFHSFDLATGEHVVVTDLPKYVCAFGLRKEGQDGYIFAWEDGFQLYDPHTRTELSKYSVGEAVNPNQLPTRLNDGKCCPSGKRFICGGYYGDIEGMYMKVYKVEAETDKSGEISLKHEPVVDKIQVTNSMCWSPDRKTMYLADSPTATIFQHDYDMEKGELSNRRVLRKYSVGVPDGSCCDNEGNVWNSVWMDGERQSYVQCTNPEGEVIYTITLPDNSSQLTCCCFGGPDLDVLFISSANINIDMEKEPFAGSVYAVKLGVKGQVEPRFG